MTKRKGVVQKLFFSQRKLDSLIDEGTIKLENNVLTLLSGKNPSFVLEPAVRILKTADGSADPHHLVGKYKYEKDLKTMNAEVYLDSIIYSDVAYVVEPGFIGSKQDLLDSLSDTDLLSKFLLENLL